MSSTGLSPRAAATLAYSGWWVTGLIFWLFERRNPIVRFHAAQAIVVFGATALLVMLLAALAAASLSFLPSMFGVFAGAAALIWVAGVVLWAVAMWKTANGEEWILPAAARWVGRLTAQ